MQEQRARHARLAPSVIRQEHLGESVRFTFASDLDRAALAEMVAVEEQCCPFFKFSFAETERQLLVTVSDQEMLPALEAIASAGRRQLTGSAADRLRQGVDRRPRTADGA